MRRTRFLDILNKLVVTVAFIATYHPALANEPFIAAAMIEFTASPTELKESVRTRIEGVVKSLRNPYFCRINPLLVSARFDWNAPDTVSEKALAEERARTVATELQRQGIPTDLIYIATEGTSADKVGKNLVDVQAMGWGKGWGGNAPCNNPLLPSSGDR